MPVVYREVKLVFSSCLLLKLFDQSVCIINTLSLMVCHDFFNKNKNILSKINLAGRKLNSLLVKLVRPSFTFLHFLIIK